MTDATTRSDDPSEPIFEVADGRSGDTFGISLSTLLLSLQVAERLHLVPPVPEEWWVALGQSPRAG